jgi:glycosyltransferase involved in cell wall biosynthesis
VENLAATKRRQAKITIMEDNPRSVTDAARPRVSIIVSVRNGAEFVDKNVQCILDQEFKDHETVYVVAADSKDDSLAKVNEGLKRLSNARVVLQTEKTGLGGAKNIGIDNAKGDYLWFLDVDDVPSPRYLSKLIAIIDQYDADVAGANFVYSSHAVPIPESKKYRYELKVMSRNEALTARAQERFPVTSWSMLYRRSMIVDHNVRFEKGFNEDIGFTYRALAASKVVTYTSEPLYTYVQNPESICHLKNVDYNRGMTEIGVYDRLEKMFVGDSFERQFKRDGALVRIRSSGHMAYGDFIRYARSPECREMYERCLKEPRSFEGTMYMWFPDLYYMAIRIFFKVFYYSNGKLFTPIKNHVIGISYNMILR